MYRTHHPTHHPGSHVMATCQRCGVELRGLQAVEQPCSPDPGFRLLEPGEAFRPGDEAIRRDSNIPLDAWDFGKAYDPKHHVPIRRPLRRCAGCHRTPDVAQANPCHQCEVPQ